MSRSTMKIAKHFEGHKHIEQVDYLGLESHPLHELIRVQGGDTHAAEELYRLGQNTKYAVTLYSELQAKAEDERQAGALLYFGLNKPLSMSGSKAEYPSPVEFLHTAKEHKYGSA